MATTLDTLGSYRRTDLPAAGRGVQRSCATRRRARTQWEPSPASLCILPGPHGDLRTERSRRTKPATSTSTACRPLRCRTRSARTTCSRDIFSRIMIGARNSARRRVRAIAVSTVLGVMLGVIERLPRRRSRPRRSAACIDVMLAFPALGLRDLLRDHLRPRAYYGGAGDRAGPDAGHSPHRAQRDDRHPAPSSSSRRRSASGNSPLRIMLPAHPAQRRGADHRHRQRADRYCHPDRGGDQLPRPGRQQRYEPQLGPHAAGDAHRLAACVVDDGGARRGDQRRGDCSFNIFGDALRDWLDPRLRGSR